MQTLKKIGGHVMVPLASLIGPLMAIAAPAPAPITPTGPGIISGATDVPTIATTATGVLGILCVILTWVFYALIVLTVIFVIVAAFKYLTSGGDPEKVSSANHMIVYAVVAIVVALIARGFPFIIGSIFGATINSC